MGKSRSAHHTLNGYHYQFDKSILEILRATEGRSVTLEGVEDIDVDDEAIQCKYHATKKYTPSAIKKPLLAFLNHYATSNAPLTYTLYAHFADHSSFVAIDLAELKKIVKDDADSLNLSDTDLNVFLSRHFRYEQAGDIDEQREEVHQELHTSIGCQRNESDLFFYPNALHEVIRLSRQPDATGRVTDRTSFLRAINHKRTLFSVWLCQLKGQAEYVSFVRKELKAKAAMATTKRRCIHIDHRLVQQCGVAGLTRFCEAMIDAHFKVGRSLKNAVPILVVVHASKDDIVGVKRALLERQHLVNDGYEYIGFQPWVFNAAPIINVKTTQTGKATDTIAASSYALRLVSHDTYLANNQDIDAPDTVVFTSTVTELPFESSPHTSVFHVAEIANLDDLGAVLS